MLLTNDIDPPPPPPPMHTELGRGQGQTHFAVSASAIYDPDRVDVASLPRASYVP